MRSDLAIRLENVSKVYQLHGTRRDQFIHVMGLDRIGFKPRTPAIEFKALDDVSLDVPKGHRIGIIGRNGAGKTTLLKLICGNYSPTAGKVLVNGSVQALMSVGLGFHPEYTGRENIEASLHYNNLCAADYREAIADIIDFAELGAFIDQPFKTYSLGMQARLMFAASTAIKPDILIVDEALGAGDAYFVAKSKQRIQHLVNSGCTLLLVSHSTSQVLELCDEAIWLENGVVKMQAGAFSVIKAYEKHISAMPPSQNQVAVQISAGDGGFRALESPKASQTLSGLVVHGIGSPNPALLLQEPTFRPNTARVTLPSYQGNPKFEFVSRDGVSRWGEENPHELEITGFNVISDREPHQPLLPLHPAKLAFAVLVKKPAQYKCRYVIVITNYNGQTLTRFRSPIDSFKGCVGDHRTVELTLNPLQYGSGSYVVSLGVFHYTPLQYINNAKCYDLLSRSFTFDVKLPDSEEANECQFFHTGEWAFTSNGNT